VLAGVVGAGPFADLNFYNFASMAALRQIALDQVRSRLGDEQYDRAVRLGSAFSFEEVVQYARQLFEDLEHDSLGRRSSMQVSAELG
jgi:hypothetical protein